MENENLKGKLIIKDENMKELFEKVEKTRHEINKIKSEVKFIHLSLIAFEIKHV